MTRSCLLDVIINHLKRKSSKRCVVSTKNYFRIFLLKIAQGLVKDSLKPVMTPLRVRENELFPRNVCIACKDANPNKANLYNL